MILVVNPNPAVDRVAVVRYAPRRTLRPERFLLWPGGSGVHAGHVAWVLGSAVRVAGFAGGHTGALFASLLAQHGLDSDLFPADGETRQTYTLLDVRDGNLCDVAEAGPPVGQAAVGALLAAVRAHAQAASIIVLSGSNPPGCGDDLSAAVAAIGRDAGTPVLADLAGTALEAAVGAVPWLIKPSLEELDAAAGHPLGGAELLELCRSWHGRGVANVCVSLGARGVLWYSADGCRHVGIAAEPAPYNTVGCGDALVGALAAASDQGRGLADALCTAVAAASANIRYDEPGHCTPQDVAALRQRTWLSPMADVAVCRLLTGRRHDSDDEPATADARRERLECDAHQWHHPRP